jgi:FixJ family two-component response regulator
MPTTDASQPATTMVVAADPHTRHDLVRCLDGAYLRAEGYASAGALMRTRCPADAGCIVLDVDAPGLQGLVTQEQLQRAGFDQPMIVLTGFGEVAVAVHALQRGAFDLIEKPASAARLLAALEQALALDADRRHLARIRAAYRGRLGRLTPRERQVMGLVVDGMANKVVASDLGISEKTVETHRARVMEKLAVRSLAELVRLDTLHGRA